MLFFIVLFAGLISLLMKGAFLEFFWLKTEQDRSASYFETGSANSVEQTSGSQKRYFLISPNDRWSTVLWKRQSPAGTCLLSIKDNGVYPRSFTSQTRRWWLSHVPSSPLSLLWRLYWCHHGPLWLSVGLFCTSWSQSEPPVVYTAASTMGSFENQEFLRLGCSKVFSRVCRMCTVMWWVFKILF